MLYNAYPKALTVPDFCGTTPVSLAYLLEYPITTLQTLLELQPDASISRPPSLFGQTVLKHMTSLWTKQISSSLLTPQKIQADEVLLDQWDKFMLTIRAAVQTSCPKLKENKNKAHTGEDQSYASNLQSEEKNINDWILTPQLHASLRLPIPHRLPTNLMVIIVQMYPQHLTMRMKTNNSSACSTLLPLHYVLNNLMPKAAKSHDEVTTNLSILKTMLELSTKEASIPDPTRNNALPLHVAIEIGLTWNKDGGLFDIFCAYPEALYMMHPKSSLPIIFHNTPTHEYDCQRCLKSIQSNHTHLLETESKLIDLLLCIYCLTNKVDCFKNNDKD